MQAAFFGWRGLVKCFGVLFEGRDRILLLGKALKFGLILQNFALKLLKIWNFLEKIPEKMKNFHLKFSFFARDVGKIRIIIDSPAFYSKI